MHSQGRRSEIAALILRKTFMQGGATDEDVIEEMQIAVGRQVNIKVISMVEVLLNVTPSYTIQMAIDALWDRIAGRMEVIVSIDSPDALINQPDCPSDKSLEGEVIFADHISEDLEESKPALAMYPHIPPKYIDLHPDMTLRTGLFRTLPKSKERALLNERQVYELGKALSNGYRYMTVKGPILDTDIDLTTYLCLTHWFGRMDVRTFEDATNKPITMTIEEFYSPIPKTQKPSDYLVNELLLDSFGRIKTVALIFYPTLADAEGMTRKRSGMVTNIAGTLNLRPDGKVEISPTPELRNLYTSTKRLMPLNRSSVIGLPNQMARILALWLASKPGFSDNEWTQLNNITITAGDLLTEIHPKERHTHNDLQLVSDALNAMTEARLVKYDVVFKNAKIKASSEGCKKLTLASKIIFFAHRLANKRVFIATELTDKDLGETLGNPLFPTKRPVMGNAEVKRIFAHLSFPRGRHLSKDVVSSWLSMNEDRLIPLISIIRKAYEKSNQEAQSALAGIHRNKKTALVNALELCGMDSDALMIKEIMTYKPQSKKPGPIESLIHPVESLVRSLPLKKPYVSSSEWYDENKKTISAIRSALKESSNPLHDMASINKRVLFGRLIKPLKLAERNKDADYFAGLYYAGQDSKEDDAVSNRNRNRRR